MVIGAECYYGVGGWYTGTPLSCGTWHGISPLGKPLRWVLCFGFADTPFLIGWPSSSEEWLYESALVEVLCFCGLTHTVFIIEFTVLIGTIWSCFWFANGQRQTWIVWCIFNKSKCMLPNIRRVGWVKIPPVYVPSTTLVFSRESSFLLWSRGVSVPWILEKTGIPSRLYPSHVPCAAGPSPTLARINR